MFKYFKKFNKKVAGEEFETVATFGELAHHRFGDVYRRKFEIC